MFSMLLYKDNKENYGIERRHLRKNFKVFYVVTKQMFLLVI